MLCPYNRRQEKQILKMVNSFDDEGQNDGAQQVVTTMFAMMECPESGCAVWRNGSCHYAAIDLQNQ